MTHDVFAHTRHPPQNGFDHVSTHGGHQQTATGHPCVHASHDMLHVSWFAELDTELKPPFAKGRRPINAYLATWDVWVRLGEPPRTRTYERH